MVDIAGASHRLAILGQGGHEAVAELKPQKERSGMRDDGGAGSILGCSWGRDRVAAQRTGLGGWGLVDGFLACLVGVVVQR